MRTLVCAVCAVLLLAAPARAQVQHERWPIKTGTKIHLSATVHSVTCATLEGLHGLPHVAPSTVTTSFIPDSPQGSTLHEGDLVKTECYIRLIAWEKAGDSDYHLQATHSRDGSERCVIMEVPDPGVAGVPAALQTRFRNMRSNLESKLLHGVAFSSSGNLMNHGVHVEVTGQLFYDTHHQSDPSSRGKRGMKAANAWELHPVTAIQFLDVIHH